MSDSPNPPTLLSLIVAFANIGLTSVGGAGGPLRYVVVKQRRWLSEGALAELFGVAQALPGATAVNIAVMFSDRAVGPLGPLAALFGLIVPSLIIAIALAGIATQLAAVNYRFAAAEVGVTAAVAGIFISNGFRVMGQLWSETPDLQLVWRSSRVAISALGIVMVAGFHIFIPLTMVVLVTLSLLLEWRIPRNPELVEGPPPVDPIDPIDEKQS